jgi:glutamate-1-semialdehyde aminotransferase
VGNGATPGGHRVGDEAEPQGIRLGGVLEKRIRRARQQSVAKRMEYHHRLFMARSRSRSAKKQSAADEEASTCVAAAFVDTTVVLALNELEGAGDCVAATAE